MRPHIVLSLVPLFASFALGCGDDAAGGDSDDTFGPDTIDPLDTDKDTGGPGDGSGGNHPPELERIGDRSVAVSQTLTITLSGKDPDGDVLTYSVFGSLPDGARFDKAEHRFEWQPTEANKTVFLTFVVSDGTDLDRETVRIQVTETATSSPPSFTEVGDQILPVDQPYTLTLVATDPDGDRLSYGHEGTLPNGAALDGKTGVFTWRPTAADVGATARITFTVSDGTNSDTMAVRFVVDDGGGAVNKPPVFAAIAPQSAVVGQPLTLTLVANDPNGDAVTFSIQGATPPGASLAGATFTYTAQQSEVGQTLEVTFAADDGTFTAVTSVKISVTSGQTATCTPDPEEPNGDQATATALTVPGSRTASLCETPTTFDEDVYALTIPAGQSLAAKLTFDAALGDIDLFLIDGAGADLASSTGVSDVEELRWSAQSQTQAFLVVTGYGLEPLAMTYTLETSLGAAPAQCSEDTYEENDTAFDAKPLDDAAQATTLQICAGDEDFWTLSVGCGARVEVLLEAKAAADLDMYLWDDLSDAGEPIAAAITEEAAVGATESIDVPQAQRPGTWLLIVAGYPAPTAESGYEIIADVSGACQDDGQSGASKAAAKPMAGANGDLTGLTICCTDDWFSMALAAGDQVTFDLAITSGSLGAVVLAPDGTTQIAAKEPSENGGLMLFSADAAGTYYIKFSGTVGARYGVGWSVQSGATGCTLMSCDKFENCNTSNGQCEPDPWCFADVECQPGFVCRESYCVNPCAGPAECRPGYACKAFDDTPVATYCGATGPGTTGASCDAHAECEGTLACVLDGHGGYCAQVGCGSCPAGTACTTIAGFDVCAKSCATNADCREAAGYICTAEKLCLPQNP